MVLNNGIWDPKPRVTSIKRTNLKFLNKPGHCGEGGLVHRCLGVEAELGEVLLTSGFI